MCLQTSAKLGDDGGLVWLLGEVVELVGVSAVIVEFSASAAFVPFGIATALGTNAAAHDGRAGTWAKDLCEGGVGPFAHGIVEQRAQSSAGELLWSRQSCEVGEGWVDVHELHDALRSRVRCRWQWACG